MRYPTLTAVTLSMAFACLPARAQAPDVGTMTSDAVATLKGAAKDRLLVGDMIGSPVNGPSGSEVGTIANLVAIPGGRLVAVVVDLSDGSKLPIPYQVMKIELAADTLNISLPVTVDELRNDSGVKELQGLLSL